MHKAPFIHGLVRLLFGFALYVVACKLCGNSFPAGWVFGALYVGVDRVVFVPSEKQEEDKKKEDSV